MQLWIARDKNSDLYLYTSKPGKEVKWEDDEPTRLELKIVKK